MNELESLRNLKKSNTDCKIAGVCGGFGEYTALPSWCWRAIFLFSLFLGGLGLIAYIILWICMPNAGTTTQSSQRKPDSNQSETLV